jgi:hypothetical protein
MCPFSSVSCRAYRMYRCERGKTAMHRVTDQEQCPLVLLTMTLTGPAAADLGYLLFKHPAKVQSFDVSVGVAHVFYPEAGEQRCTAALLLEVDPIALVRGQRGATVAGFSLGQYVNDRPYAASSMVSVAIGWVFRTAMNGRCDQRPELAATALPLELHVPAPPCRGGADLATRLFGPLGWTVRAEPIPHADLTDLSGQSAGRCGRGGPDGRHRTRRPAAPGRARAHGLRRHRAGNRADASTCASSTAPTTPNRPTWTECANAGSATNAPWPLANTRSAWKPWTEPPEANRCGGCTNASSPCSRSNPNRSTRAYDEVTQTQNG